MRRRFAACCCCGLALWLVTAATGCRRPQSDVDTATPDLSATAQEQAPTPQPGRHALTAAAPITITDLGRMLALGFTPEEVLAAIRQRGVLAAPDNAERERIQRMPEGNRLAEAMDAPANLLTPEAADSHARHLAGGFNREQFQAAVDHARRTSPTAGAVSGYTAYGAASVTASNARHRQELTSRINTLKLKRVEMRRRGEAAEILTLEIERLEREKASLPNAS